MFEAFVLLGGLFALGYMATQSKTNSTPEKKPDALPPVPSPKVDCTNALDKLDPETRKLVAAQLLLAGSDKAKVKAIAATISTVNKEVGDCLNAYADSLGTT